MSFKHLQSFYWGATLLFAVPQAFSALQYLLSESVMLQAIAALGYPIYFLKLLAVAKLLGVAAILYGRFPVLKEWAYAGFTFEAIAAIFSLANIGNTLQVVAMPCAFLVLQLMSYWSWTQIEGRGGARGKARRRVRTPLPASAAAMRGYY